jgi:hypothetical protein
LASIALKARKWSDERFYRIEEMLNAVPIPYPGILKDIGVKEDIA